MLPSLKLSVLGEKRDLEREKQDRRGARAGDIIGGRYVVDGQIGRGGMGRVLKVRHCVLDKAFALKLPKAREAHNPESRRRFYREARLASSLSHSNICSVVDFGEDPRFGLFMVMELLEGQNLHSKLRHEGGLSPKVACDVMRQIAEASRYVHSRGIVHSDIKSENILLTRTSLNHRLVKLLDFGLALGQDAPTGGVHGTPEYLAPERIRDESAATVASDIYSLGIVFWELLVGRTPFEGQPKEVLRQQMEDEIPSLLTVLQAPIDERADLIVGRATHKDPEKRHPTVDAFLYELRTFINMNGFGPRRRSESSGYAVRRAVERSVRGGSEVFDCAPIPLAAVTLDGTLSIANRAFVDFLGETQPLASTRVLDTGLVKVYPTVLADINTVARTGTSMTTVVDLAAGGDEIVSVAVVLTAPAGELAESGPVHVAIYPLSSVELTGE